ncbi:unnamed protein product [Alternaria alternata]
MPRYDMNSGRVDARDPHWLAYRVADALASHTTNIISNFEHDAGGWEGWLQVELMSAFTALYDSAATWARRTSLFESVETEFLREEAYKPASDDDRLPEPFRNFVPVDNSFITLDGSTYRQWKKVSEPKAKVQRADFVIRVEVDGELSESHYVELKCRSSKESSSEFVSRVKEDIKKVRQTDWAAWRTTESALSVWIVAVSIGSTDEVDQRMNDAAREAGFQWNVIPLANFADGAGEMKIWAHGERYRGFDTELLFGYASQHSLQKYAEFGEVERPEPSYDPEEHYM